MNKETNFKCDQLLLFIQQYQLDRLQKFLISGSGSGLSSGSSSTGEEDESTKSELTQTLLKTIAKLTHGASVEQAEKVNFGF